MLIVLKVIALIIIGILCLIFTLLLSLVLIPFYCRGDLRRDEVFNAVVDIRWFWGILGLRINFNPLENIFSLCIFKARILTKAIESKSKEEKKEEAPKKTEEKEKKKQKKKRKKRELSLDEKLGQGIATFKTLSLETLNELILFFLRIFSSLKLVISGEAEVGFVDPADTGMFLGIFSALTGTFQLTKFKLQPNWDETTLKGNVILKGRVWLISFIISVVRFILARSIRRIWWNIVKGKIKARGGLRSQPAK